jgi:hypothetical protein
MAKLQAPQHDGIRRTRAVVVRNTMPQLRDTTITSWNYWFKDGEAGTWHASRSSFVFGSVMSRCEVLFRPLDTAQDVARVLSLEVTFALLDEFVQIPREIVDALSARLGRFPASKDGGATNWGMWGSSNPDTEDNWWFDYLHANPSVEMVRNVLADDDAADMKRIIEGQGDANGKYFIQPSGLSPAAENIENLPGKRAYYTNQIKGKSDAWIKQFVEAEWGYSIAGKPVIPDLQGRPSRLAKSKLLWNPQLPLVIGLDPGSGGSALIIGQEDHHGRLLVLGELVQAGSGPRSWSKSAEALPARPLPGHRPEPRHHRAGSFRGEPLAERQEDGRAGVRQALHGEAREQQPAAAAHRRDHALHDAPDRRTGRRCRSTRPSARSSPGR